MCKIFADETSIYFFNVNNKSNSNANLNSDKISKWDFQWKMSSNQVTRNFSMLLSGETNNK